MGSQIFFESRSQVYGNQITANTSGMKWPYVQLRM